MPRHGVDASGRSEEGPRPAPPAAALVGLLADEDRLRCLAAVVLGATTAAEVAERSGLELRSAIRALERLAGAGLVDRGPGGLAVRVALFREAARAAASERPDVDPERLGATPEQAGVLRKFVSADGRLASIPTAKAKRLVVLDFLAGRFEPGRVYPENDVNGILGRVHDDYAALRRYLVDEGFLERRDGFYWRAGGTYEV
ncbi:MAG TPA: DUF2087 domain-containing protein [Acidimicrobiales bacterium]|nr:DUF2087 domain-containing protein [Acidimicrobiales bacterium]